MTSQRPNVLLITSDQQHFSTLAYAANNPTIRTPHLDRLAKRGMMFDRAYCPNPTCTPSRASILTGMYPSTHGAWSLGCKTPQDQLFLGDLFRQSGYDASLIGKAHFQPLDDDPERPETRSIEKQPILRDLDFWQRFNKTSTPWYGFNHVETCRNHTDEAHAGGHYALWMKHKGLEDWEKHFDVPNGPYGSGRSQKHKWSLPEQYHYSVWTAERTMARMEHCVANDTPFFCWSSFHDPHPSYLVPEPWDTMYDPSEVRVGHLHRNADGTTELDKMPLPHRMTQDPDADWSPFRESGYANHGFAYHAGKSEAELRKDVAVYYGMTSLMDREIGRILDKLDELGQTDNTLIVFTTDHGHFYGHHGLTAKGAFHYDDGIRLPFLASWPGVIPENVRCSAITNLVDLAPTLLAACGLDVPERMQGRDQMPVWRGEAESISDSTFCEFRHQPTKLHLRTYINERYKLTLWRGHPDWGELFDLREDPGEIDNKFDDPDYAALRSDLIYEMQHADIAREPTLTPRTAHA